MEIILGTLAVMAVAFGLSFLIIKYGPKEPVYQPCQHESVDQWWYDRGIRQRKCLGCGKEELSRHNTASGYKTLWNPKFINGKPLEGFELDRMRSQKANLEEKLKACSS